MTRLILIFCGKSSPKTFRMLNVPNYYGDVTQRELVIELADYLARKLDTLRPEEASAARVLRERVKNQRLG